jgi:hypothetical protein
MGIATRINPTTFSLLFSAFIALAPILNATAPAADPDKTLQAIPISEPIVLDGRLDETAWAQAPVGTDFVQREPDTGQPATERTEVRVVYTPQTLYVAINALDREPDKIIAKEMQRDEPLWRDDAVDILLDTFDDDRNAYLFETNPNGARTDALITDEGRDFNLQWDGVWDVGARKTSEGWCAELAIPFRTLRFDPEAEAWGFNVLRYIRRRSEEVFWAPILLDADVKRVSQYGRLSGIEGVEQGWNLNVLPFTVGTSADTPEPDDPRAGEDLDFGLDVKKGLGRSLSLDLTVNTDFAETEVDALQVNLTRFSLFFPETREFFLENAGIFDFGPRDTGGSGPLMRILGGDPPLLKVFFSRRIGLSASGEEVPIEWGARLTGRAGGWNVGALDVQTDSVVLGQTVDVPRNNWGTARATRNFGERSSVGAIFTQRHGSENTNRVVGFDLDYKPTPNLGIYSYAAASDNSGFGRPGDWAAGTAATWDGEFWDWRVGFDRIGDDFDPQVGFLWRRGVHRYDALVTYEPRPEIPKILKLHFEYSGRVYTNLGGQVETQQHRLDLFGLRTTNADLGAIYTLYGFERLHEPFEIVPGVVIPEGDYGFPAVGARFLTDFSRPASAEGKIEAGKFYDGNRLGGQLLLRLRPNRFLRSETAWVFDDVEVSGGDFTSHVVRQRFAVALTPRVLSSFFVQYNHLDELWSVNLRFNWIYRPGSDLFFVYRQTWDPSRDGGSSRRDRQFIVKFTYLFQR